MKVSSEYNEGVIFTVVTGTRHKLLCRILYYGELCPNEYSHLLRPDNF